MERLNGKVAVVTGSARGIGRAIAMLFGQEGAYIVVNDIDQAPALEVAREIETGGGEAMVWIADIRKPDEAQKLMDTAVERFGKLDILVNNAGIARDALIHKMTDSQWDLCLDINLKGTFNCLRAASRYMMKKGHGGTIINVSSVSGLMGNIGQVNYSAAKAGLIGLTKTVAREWARFGINCNAIAFGAVETRFTGEKETGDEVFGERVGIPRKVRDIQFQELAGKLMKPEEVARPVLFLASDDAAFITGHVLNVSAGWYM